MVYGLWCLGLRFRVSGSVFKVYVGGSGRFRPLLGAFREDILGSASSRPNPKP